MSGICGFIGALDDRQRVISRMANALIHRGPDDGFSFDDGVVSVAYRHLDTDAAPFQRESVWSEDGSTLILFDGRIYDREFLRGELVAAGHQLPAQVSDAQLVLHGFEEWGEGVLHRLRGMWALAIHDLEEGTLFLARDRFGIKPLYYLQAGGCFAYASEIKSLLQCPAYERAVNLEALDHYLTFQHAAPWETFFEGIDCLLPGHYLWYEGGQVGITRYWEPRFRPDPLMEEELAIEDVSQVLEDSVRVHRISSAPLGCLLSSGVDSSYLASYFPGQHTFTVGFDQGERYDETAYAHDLAREVGTIQHSRLLSSQEYWEVLPKVAYYLDQPLGDPRVAPLFCAFKLASKHVKVLFSGAGANEIFGGYTIYTEPASRRRYQQLVPYGVRKGLGRLASKLPEMRGRDFLIKASRTVMDTYTGYGFAFDLDDKRRLLKDPSLATRPQSLTQPIYQRANCSDAETMMQYLDINLWLVGDVLHSADRMASANSLELRLPYLDDEVFKVAAHIPTHLRANSESTKYVLRMVAQQRLPEGVANRRTLGLPVPLAVWLRNERYYGRVKRAFQSAAAQRFFNTDVLMAYLDDHFDGKRDESRRIWTVYSFLLWYQQFFTD